MTCVFCHNKEVAGEASINYINYLKAVHKIECKANYDKYVDLPKTEYFNNKGNGFMVLNVIFLDYVWKRKGEK